MGTKPTFSSITAASDSNEHGSLPKPTSPQDERGTVGFPDEQIRSPSVSLLLETLTDRPIHFGNYLVLHKIAEGAMGVVFKAHDMVRDCIVALKIPKISVSDQDSLQRFRQESSVMMQLRHDNICPVHDAGDVNGTPYLAMEYIEGITLETFLSNRQTLSSRKAAELLVQIAEGVEVAHRSGIVHRDLKPANVMLNSRQEPIVLDFGLAMNQDSDEHVITQGTLLGTPAYMPPEQADGNLGDICPASDVYALGAMLYEMITGRSPIRDSQTRWSQEDDQVIPPSRFRDDLDARFEAICLKALAPKILDRYESAAALAQAISQHLQLLDRESAQLHKLRAKRQEQVTEVRTLWEEQDYTSAAKILNRMSQDRRACVAEYTIWARNEYIRVKRMVSEPQTLYLKPLTGVVEARATEPVSLECVDVAKIERTENLPRVSSDVSKDSSQWLTFATAMFFAFSLYVGALISVSQVSSNQSWHDRALQTVGQEGVDANARTSQLEAHSMTSEIPESHADGLISSIEPDAAPSTIDLQTDLVSQLIALSDI